MSELNREKVASILQQRAKELGFDMSRQAARDLSLPLWAEFQVAIVRACADAADKAYLEGLDR